MSDKIKLTFEEAVKDIPNGASIMSDGFGGPGGCAQNLILALRNQGAKNLTIIGNSPVLSSFRPDMKGRYIDCNVLLENGQVRKVIASFPILTIVAHRRSLLEEKVMSGEVELEVIPQGTFALRIWMAGAGVGGAFIPVGVGTVFERGKEKKVINGKEHLLELPLEADYAFVRASKADTMGNLVYRLTSRSFNPVMATAAKTTIAEVDEIVEPGELPPEVIITSGIYVDRIVKIPRGINENKA